MACADAAPRHQPFQLRPTREPGSEPLPGYRLIEPLGSGGFGEVWKCEAPGGLLKAIKFVQGTHGLNLGHEAPADEELRAIQRVKAIRHPFLLSMERLEQVGGELVIVLELADRSLADVLVQEQEAGRPGIPRDQLLGYLREAAEALDLMNLHYDLQHLDIKPQNLFLVSNHVKVGDFGLVHSLQSVKANRPPTLRLGAITPLYSSPEAFENGISRHSDQYSLAIVYQELLTGTLPFTGKNSRQLLMQHLQGEPDLRSLPAADRSAVARALSKKPADRFPSCSDFIHALVAGQTEVIATTGLVPGPERPPQGPEPADTEAKRDTGQASIADTRPMEESLEDLQFDQCVSCTPLTEVWKAHTPNGRERLAKVVFGYAGNEDDLSARLRALRHPALVSASVARNTPSGLVLITAPLGKSLRVRFQECVAQGLPGIPRDQLLGHVRAAALALDFLYQRHRVAHLGLNPRNLLVDSGRLLIADFGLAQLLWLPAGQAVAQLNSRYSAPELFQKQAGPACDQYSLALIYHELLTGALPTVQQTRGKSASGSSVRPVLARLTETEHTVLARALDPDPGRRWPSCTDMVRALEGASEERVSETAPAATGCQTAARALPAEEGVLQTRFGTILSADQIRLRLDGFREQWKGTVVGPRNGEQDASEFLYRLRTPQSFWQRWTGRHPGLEVCIRLTTPPPSARVTTEVGVEIRPTDCGREQSGERLKVIGPLLVESVRSFLQVNARGRIEERLAWHHPLRVCPVGADGVVGEPIDCQGKDISLNGIGFYLPGELPTTQVLLHLPQTPQTPALTVPARVVRIQGCGEGWCEVGAVLLRQEEPVTERV